MYRKFELADKVLFVRQYNTKLELEILETLKFNELTEDELECIADEFLDYCLKKHCKLSKIEKILTIWYIRSITLGDEISVIYKCPNCGKTQNTVINLNDYLSFPTKKSEYIKSKILSDTEFLKLKKENILPDDLDIDVFESLNVFDYFSIYNEKINLKCDKCNSETFSELFTFKQCLSFLSEDSLESLTSWIHILVYSDHHTRSDILNMTPLERMIEINYFKEQCEKENENAE